MATFDAFFMLDHVWFAKLPECGQEMLQYFGGRRSCPPYMGLIYLFVYPKEKRKRGILGTHILDSHLWRPCTGCWAMSTNMSTTGELPAAAGAAHRILALYRFVPLVGETPDLSSAPERHPALLSLKADLLAALRPRGVRGTLVLAPEGVNGTISYPAKLSSGAAGGAGEGADPVMSYLASHPRLRGPDLRLRSSTWTSPDPLTAPFQRLKVKIKAEIVTMGLGRPLVGRAPVLDGEDGRRERMERNRRADPHAARGKYLSPVEWDSACRDPDVLVIDVRNTYEVAVGTFEGAVDPKTESFADFPRWLEGLTGEFDWGAEDAGRGAGEGLRPALKAAAADEAAPGVAGGAADGRSEAKRRPPKGIAMFCTGGIRCEKATSYALQSGLFPGVSVYHLNGGILAYLDDAACDGARPAGGGGGNFRGECFVFDARVAVGPGLAPTATYAACCGCRGPLDKRLLPPPPSGEAPPTPEAARRHAALAGGIAGVPPLRADPATGREYVPGLTCPRCHAGVTRKRLEGFAMRKAQVERCSERGMAHFEDRAGLLA